MANIDFSSQAIDPEAQKADQEAARSASPGLDFSDQAPEVTDEKVLAQYGVTPKRGNLPPELDAEAREYARKRAESEYDQSMFNIGDKSKSLAADATLMRDSMSLGGVQKIQGLLESEMFGGKGREFGEAAYQYYLDETRKRAHLPGVSSFAGSMLTPSPVKGTGLATNVAEGAITSGIETAARQTPSEADLGKVGTSAGVGGAFSGAVDVLGKGLGLGSGSPETAGMSPRDIKGKQIQEVANQARSTFDLPTNSAVAGRDFADKVTKEVSRLKSSGRRRVTDSIKSDKFEIGTINTSVRNKDQVTKEFANFQRELGPDKTIELTNTISEISEILAPEKLSKVQEREAIANIISDEYPDLGPYVKKWRSFMDELDALGAEGGATSANAVESVNPWGQMNTAVRGKNYESVRTQRGEDFTPVPISPEGTPGAYRLREVLADESSIDKNLNIKDWDALQTRIRGLKSSARSSGNASDLAAIEDMETAIKDTVNSMVSRGEVQGDLNKWVEYNVGKGKLRQAMDLQDSTTLNKILNENTVTGSYIADQFFRIDSPSRGNQAAKNIRQIAESLGEDSEALSSLRAGILAETFKEGKPSEILARVTKLTDDPDLIAMFPDDIANDLTELAMSMHQVDLSNINPRKDIIGPVIEEIAEKLGGAAGKKAVQVGGKLSGPMSITGGAVYGLTGNPAAAATAATGAAVLRQLARKPVRRAIKGAAGMASAGIGREAAQSGITDTAQSVVDSYMSDEEMEQNVLPGVVGGL